MIALLPPIARRRLPLVTALAVVTCSIALSVAVAAQDLPVLVHGEAQGLYREASSSIESYVSTEVDASLQIYAFRPFTGDLKQAFGTTLLREWIEPQHRETAVAGMPTVRQRRAARCRRSLWGSVRRECRRWNVAPPDAAGHSGKAGCRPRRCLSGEPV